VRTKITLTALLALLLIPTSAPAQAHDLLVNISPAPGAVVASSSFEAVLTFNNPLLVIEGETNAELSTKLVDSTEWTAHPLEISGTTLVALVVVAEAGSYDLRWSVVSSDGHQISGDSTFAVDIATIEGGEAVALTAVEPEQSAAESAEIPAGFYVGLLMVALGAVFAPIGLMMRRRSKKS
jgi:methionine-rich copper-binding protein CopC